MSTIQLRRGTAAQWTTANPTLAAGEAGYEVDTGKLKIGDGTTVWASLPYATVLPDDSRLSDARPPTAHTHSPSEITGTAVVTTDPRLSDARTPTAHTHGAADVTSGTLDISRIPTGTTGTTVALGNHTHAGVYDPAGTAASAVSAHESDTTSVHGIANTADLVLTSDARLSDARTPTAHTHAPSDITGTAVVTTDPRLSDARTPTAHVHSGADITSGTVGITYLPTGTTGSTVALGNHTHAGVYDPAGTAASAVSSHESDTTNVHGIADTAALTTLGEVVAIATCNITF